MNQQSIELGGIVRNMPDNTVKDGSMLELINLRPKDGALRPVGAKALMDSTPTDLRFIHQISSTKQIYIGSDNMTMVTYWVCTNGVFGSPVTLSLQSQPGDLMSFAALKNTLMITDNLNELPNVLIFNEDTDTYTLFDVADGDEGFLPDMPHVTLSRTAYVAGDKTNTFTSSRESVDDSLLSEYLKMQSDRADTGFLTGCILVRCAFELMDGSIVRHTVPQKLWTSEIDISAPAGTDPIVTTIFTAYVIGFKLNCTEPWLTDVQTRYKNIIRNFQVYVTRPKSPTLVKSETEIPVGPKVLHHTIFDVGHLDEYIPDIETEAYYLLKEIAFEDLVADTNMSLIIPSDPKTVNDLDTRKQMPVDNFSHHCVFGRRLFSYNERIFLADIKNYLYPGEQLTGLVTPTSANFPGAAYDIGIEYDIVTGTNKTVTVFTYWGSFTHYNSLGQIAFNINYQTLTIRGAVIDNANSYWGYPDSRAKTARIYVRQGSVVKLAQTVQLTANQAQNFAYASGVSVAYDFAAGVASAVTYAQNYYYDYNRVQATELNNPFYFPAINSYRIGLGKVLGMSTNAIALSQGQFGQFPVYCFTTDGIWTMSIGTGETLISTITPLSREVCNNPAGITPIDGGTAFSTEKGLFIISGNQVIEISQIAEGPHTGRLPSGCESDIIDNPATSSILSYTCSVQFLSYLAGAIIGYDYINKEIIISNDTYNYSWVYSLSYKSWFKITESFKRFVNDFPLMYGAKDTTTTVFVPGSPVINYGALYNWYAATDARNICSAGWHIPTNTEWNTLMVYTSYSSAGLKETGFINWLTPNTGATNALGFNARGSATRIWNTGAFTFITRYYYAHSSDYDNVGGSDRSGITMRYNSTAFSSTYGADSGRTGKSIRPLKDSTTLNSGENSLYVGNDGKVYRTICIGTQEWVADNIAETKYRDGSDIPIVTDNATWAALTDGAMCYYENNVDNAYTIPTIEITTVAPLIYNLTAEDFTNLPMVYAETRPLKLSPVAFKKLHRLLLNGYINDSSTYSLGLYMAGTMDNKNWYQLNNTRYFHAQEVMLLNRSQYSCRYFLLAFGGRVDQEAYFNSISVHTEDRYQSKLR